ncbi:MAG: carbamoyltransferase N-terminal domain-containing protein [Mariprofundaceae bacterium]
MIILGINDIAHHNTSAAIIKDGQVVAAIEEERLSRVKMDNSYPHRAIDEVLSIAGVTVHDVDRIALAGLSTRQQKPALNTLFKHVKRVAAHDEVIKKFYRMQQVDRYFRLLKKRPSLPEMLKDKPVDVIEHHHAHAASAYYTAPFGCEKTGVISLDGSGDFSWGSVWTGHADKMTHVMHLHAMNSIALLYSAFTVFLGFKHTRHEGKVLGLAAFGNPEPLQSRLLKEVDLDRWEDALLSPKMARATLRQFTNMGQSVIRELAADLCKEDVAAGLQAFTEKVVLHWISKVSQQLDVRNLALAGGLFANVKLNQRILELPSIENIYIHPNMGDGGLAAGAALAASAQHTLSTPSFMSHAYLGSVINEESARNALKKNKLTYQQPENLADEVAQLLADGKVVARAAGGMEYGPRALGNRTVMASCSDPSINKWLNDKFQRTEFMPFAPVVLEEYAKTYFPNWQDDQVAARFMTMTYDASDIAKKNIPAAVHVDQTARPQVIRRQDNLGYYDIIAAFHEKTGVPSVINTSFNMHEEPIVCSADDAIRAFLDAELDALILGPFLVLRGE